MDQAVKIKKTLIKCSSVTFYQAAKCGKKSENTVTKGMQSHRETVLLWCPEDQVFIVDNPEWEHPTIVGIVNVRHFIVDREQVREYYVGKKDFEADPNSSEAADVKKELDELGVKYHHKLGLVKLQDLLKSSKSKK